MKSLVVFYSRTGNTKRAAEAIAKELNADIEEIFDTKNRNGVLGYLSAGRDASLERHARIKRPKKDPARYDLIVIGTPIWAGNMSPPIREYAFQEAGRFKHVAFFCTMGDSGSESTFFKMHALCGKKPLALLALKTGETKGHEMHHKIQKFSRELLVMLPVKPLPETKKIKKREKKKHAKKHKKQRKK